MSVEAECLSFLAGLPPSGVVSSEHKAAHPFASAVPTVAAVGMALREVLERLEGRGAGIVLQEIARYHAEPGDVVVAHVPGVLAPHQREHLQAELRKAFPKNRVLVVDGGIGLEVIEAGDVAEPAAANLDGRVDP